ncbi:MAG: phage terminase small subunit [Erythrobacter sp.]|nr:phage terminase small subunit [Erythrobacter sp.]
MSSSPFLRNRTRQLARQAGRAVEAGTPQAPAPDTEAGQEYAVLKVRLHDNLRTLQDIASVDARKPLKAEFLDSFRPWLEGVLAADVAVQDEILLTGMVWALDIGDIAMALRLGAFALKHGLAMPERYSRTVACFLREDVAEIALADPDAVALIELAFLDQMTAEADMPDQAKAKLNKSLGRAWAAKAEDFDPAADNAPGGGAAAYYQQALDHLRRALQLDTKAGVKKDIEQIERRLRAAEADARSSDSGDASASDAD